MAAVWQRVAEGALRQTQHGTFFKRDRERLEDDPVVAGPISDSFEPLPDMALLWIALATIGRVYSSRRRAPERVVAAPPEFWSGEHILPPAADGRHAMTGGLHEWHEQGRR